MEAGRHFLSSSSAFPSTAQLRPTLPSSTSVLMLHEQSAPAVTSAPTTFITRHFPTSVLLQEQREEFKPLLHLFKEEKTSQATLDRSLTEIGEIFGLSKERVRQLESRAFLKLKQSLGSQGLGAYAPLLV